jgi:hypothetical protein
MARHEQLRSTPRSPLGFALAMTLAVATLWIAGLVAEVRSYTEARAPAASRVVSVQCTDEAHEPTPCLRPVVDR